MTKRMLCCICLIALLVHCVAVHAETYLDLGTGPVWTYPIPLKTLADPDDIIRLVNRDNLLPKGYPLEEPGFALVPTTVRKVSYDKMLVRQEMDDALNRMFDGAAADGRQLRVDNAYRSYGTQATMYERRLKRTGKDDGYVQPAGASEHQMGLAADIISPAWIEKDSLDNGFAATAEGKWLAENCARFGFILRYPKDATDITQVPYESWHFRYVGEAVAQYITESGLTLEEFTAEWKEAVEAYVQAGGDVSGYKFTK